MREKEKILLEGLGNPISRRIISELNSLCDGIRLDLLLLGNIAKEIRGFKEICKLSTEDGHFCWVSKFETSLGEIAVAFPLDNNLSIAVYADGEFRRGPQSYGEFENSVENILQDLKKALSKLK